MSRKRFTTEEINTIMELDKNKTNINEIAKIVKEKFGVERTPSAISQRINFLKRTASKTAGIIKEEKQPKSPELKVNVEIPKKS